MTGGSAITMKSRHSVRQRTDRRARGAYAAAAVAWPRPGTVMSLGTILLIVLILFLVGALPTWPHSRSWGYGPTGGLGLVVVVVLVLLLMGKL